MSFLTKWNAGRAIGAIVGVSVAVYFTEGPDLSFAWGALSLILGLLIGGEVGGLVQKLIAPAKNDDQEGARQNVS